MYTYIYIIYICIYIINVCADEMIEARLINSVPWANLGRFAPLGSCVQILSRSRSLKNHKGCDQRWHLAGTTRADLGV